MDKVLMKSILEKQPYKVMGAYTEVLPIGDINPDPLNAELYPNDIDTDKEHILDLREGEGGIIKIGLQDCPQLYDDENTLKSGHHRYDAVAGIKGATHIPITRSTSKYRDAVKDASKHIEGILTANKRTPVNKLTAYNNINKWIKFKTDEQNGKRPTVPEINNVGLSLGLGHKSWKKVCDVEHGYVNAKGEDVKARPELLIDLKKGYSVADIKRKQDNDHAALQKKITNPKFKEHLNLFTREMAIDLANLASEGMKFLDMTIPFRNNKDYKPFKDSDAAFKSTAIHNLITKAIPTLLQDEYGIIVTAPDKNNPMDIIGEAQDKTYNKPYSLETKTSKHQYFSSGNEKIGNHILVHFSNNYTEWFISTVYINEDVWIPEHRHITYKLWRKDIVTENPNILLGEIVDNKLITEKIK
jgi:hypothetical protein